MIRLPDTAIEAIREHGRASYRDEACGVLYGRLEGEKREVVRVAPLRNARDEQRHRRFIVTPEDYRGAEAEAARSGLALLGFYHSHPDHLGLPIGLRSRARVSLFSYVILSVEKAEPNELRSFVLASDRKQFLEEPLERKEP